MDTVQDEARHPAKRRGNSTNSHSLLCVLRPVPWPSRRRCVLEHECASASSSSLCPTTWLYAVLSSVHQEPPYHGGVIVPDSVLQGRRKRKMFPGLGSFSRHDAIYKAAEQALTAATPHATRVWDPGLGARQVHSAHIVPPSPILCFVCVKRLTFLFYVQ